MSIKDVMPTSEAAKEWGVAQVTVMQGCSGYKKSPPRFTPEECRKSGGTWLVTRGGMTRLFGDPKLK